MQVILVEDVHNLGQIGDQVSVKPGYARNYLLPKGLAMPASTENARRLAHEKRIADFKAQKARAADEDTARKMGGMSVTIARKVGEQDKLYGSVTAADLEEALAEKGLKVDRRKIQLGEAIKSLGTYEVTVALRKDVKATLTVTVEAEQD